uniref:Uncharacterized protein n=1 Tax=Rhizophora mucronata TaxID=61149 RepID=A0A2P2QEX7_RHIMU
MCSSWLFFW